MRTLLLVVLGAAAGTAAPYAIGLVIDGATARDVAALSYGLTSYFSLYTTTQVLSYYRMRVRETIFRNCYWHMPASMTELFYRRPMGMLISEDSEIDGGGIESLKDKVWNVILNYSFNIVPNYSMVVFAIVACTWANWLVGLAAILFVTFDTVLARKQNKFVMETMGPIDDRFRAWNRRVREWWNATPLVKSNGVEKRVISQVEDDVQPVLNDDYRVWHDYLPAQLTKRRLGGMLFAAPVYTYCGFEVVSGRMGIEVYTLVFFSFERIIIALQEISDAMWNVQRDLVSINRYREILTREMPFLHDRGITFDEPTVSVNFDHVSLTHGKGGIRRAILRDVSFTIESGERVALIGPSGAGKTQITNLILRAFDPTNGTVRINDHDLRDVSLETFTRFVGLVPQQMTVFEGTVRENVAFGVSHLQLTEQRPEDDQKIARALQKAGLDFEGRLTDGLETKVGYRGMRLSGGQQQRLVIAQAHFKEPRLVIADEATSALDSVSEAKVLEHLYESLPKETTVLMIAHRLSSLTRCSKIIFVRPLESCSVDQTQVTVHRSMRELYQSDPIFQEMADAQGFVPQRECA
ncbi:MAG: ABC transporter ATP-binding protein [Patescibacteria group bacterium]